jgi:hypothetical protein
MPKMIVAKNFISFAEVTEPIGHHVYNEWHHLDHLPENLSLDGVYWGERWVRTPDCQEVSTVGDPKYAGFQYVNVYWLKEPLDQSMKDWQGLAARALQWGRRPEGKYLSRPFSGWCDPVKGYVADRTLVSPDVLPLRPNRGVHLTIAQYQAPLDADLSAVFHWYDQVRIPDLLECTGAAGAWTFVHDDPAARAEKRFLRFQFVFLDEDPPAFVADVARREGGWREAGRLRDHGGIETVLFSGPLRRIVPFEYDWFD